MKPLGAFLWFMIGTSLWGWAQSPSCFNFREKESQHEFGFVSYSLREIPNVVYQYSYDHNQKFSRGYHHSIAHGLRYRYRSQQHGVRISLGFFNIADISGFEEGSVLREHRGFFHSFDLSLGYQYALFPIGKKGVFYTSLDLKRVLGSMQGNLRDEVLEDSPDPLVVETAYRERIRESSVGFNLGFDWRLGRRGSVSLETGLEGVSYKHMDNLDIRDYGTLLRYHPVHSLTLNYILGK